MTGMQAGRPGSTAISTFTDPLILAGKSTIALMRAVEGFLPLRLVWSPKWRPGETEWDVPLAYTVRGSAADKAKARALLDRTMTPLPAKTLAQELTKLNALTKRRQEDQVDTDLLVAAYVEKLAPYPGEAVVWALRRWPETKDGKWWPAWGELYEMLKGRVAERRLMLEALRA